MDVNKFNMTQFANIALDAGIDMGFNWVVAWPVNMENFEQKILMIFGNREKMRTFRPASDKWAIAQHEGIECHRGNKNLEFPESILTYSADGVRNKIHEQLLELQ